MKNKKLARSHILYPPNESGANIAGWKHETLTNGVNMPPSSSFGSDDADALNLTCIRFCHIAVLVENG